MKTHSSHPINRTAALFLQLTIVLIGVIALAALLIEPRLEGRNANSTFLQTYFTDPFLAYVYLASIPFFVALFQAFKGLEYAKQNKIFSPAAVKTLRTIKYCGLMIAGSAVAAGAYIRIAAHTSNDDPAGAIMLGIIIAFVSVLVAAVAAIGERILQNAVKLDATQPL